MKQVLILCSDGWSRLLFVQWFQLSHNVLSYVALYAATV